MVGSRGARGKAVAGPPGELSSTLCPPAALQRVMGQETGFLAAAERRRRPGLLAGAERRAEGLRAVAQRAARRTAAQAHRGRGCARKGQGGWRGGCGRGSGPQREDQVPRQGAARRAGKIVAGAAEGPEEGERDVFPAEALDPHLGGAHQRRVGDPLLPKVRPLAVVGGHGHQDQDLGRAWLGEVHAHVHGSRHGGEGHLLQQRRVALPLYVLRQAGKPPCLSAQGGGEACWRSSLQGAARPACQDAAPSLWAEPR